MMLSFIRFQGMVPYLITGSNHSVTHLTTSESRRLITWVIDHHGRQLKRSAFKEIVLDLFEDVSGMEGIDPLDAMEIINVLWSIYRGQNRP